MKKCYRKILSVAILFTVFVLVHYLHRVIVGTGNQPSTRPVRPSVANRAVLSNELNRRSGKNGKDLPPNGILRYRDVSASGYINVNYDQRSFIINNERTLILSGSVHYPRSTPGMWDHIFEEMVKDGLNAVQVYVFWNVHEFRRGQPYDFSGPANLPLFIEKAAKVGLFVNIRIGPYVCAEWNYGGLPVWLNSIPGMGLRSNSLAWEKEMERFVTDITEILEKYLARNGGPIILAQIENEYHHTYMDYVKWCGKLIAKLNLGIPWVMCNGLSAGNTINTFNGEDGQDYIQNHIKISRLSGQPLVWTENQAWFQDWGMSDNGWSYRNPEVMAYVILAWFARGGAHHNYYMWYGGNHMGRSAAMGITNKYADGANLYSDMLPNEPKRSHLTKLHKLIDSISTVLLNSNIQAYHPIYLLHYNTTTKKYVKDTKQMAFVYDNNAGHIIFLQNSEPRQIKVKYKEYYATMQPMSIIVLDKIYSILYDSSKVNSTGLHTSRIYNKHKVRLNKFSAWGDGIKGIAKDATIEQHPLEQLKVTQDKTDYLFYQTEVSIPQSDIFNFNLAMETRNANGLLVFINEHFEGAVDDHDVNARDIHMTLRIKTNDKPFTLTILSVCLGLSNVIDPYFVEQKGILGKVFIDKFDISLTTVNDESLAGNMEL